MDFFAVFRRDPSFHFAGMKVAGSDEWVAVFVGSQEECDKRMSKLHKAAQAARNIPAEKRTINSETTANAYFRVGRARVTPA